VTIKNMLICCVKLGTTTGVSTYENRLGMPPHITLDSGTVS
jgi:hypothetical protein